MMDDLKRFDEMFVGDTFCVAESNILIRKINYNSKNNAIVEDDETIVDIPDAMMVIPCKHTKIGFEEHLNQILKENYIHKGMVADILHKSRPPIYQRNGRYFIDEAEKVLEHLGYEMVIRRKKKNG